MLFCRTAVSVGGMFIRRSPTRNKASGESYFTFRLMRSERSGGKVRQLTLLNLGRHFLVAKPDWPLLCGRIDQLISGQASLLPVELSDGVERLAELGLNGVQRAAVIGSIIGRMAMPGSERATWQWLCQTSALGELLDVDFEGLSLMRLDRASDQLIRHREAIETHLFGLDETITLYDLTNTYFEGEAAAQPKAQRGRSKEKRSDCPLVTLGLVLDGSGFVRRSRVFAGNAVEAHTLQGMLTGLNAAPGALVVMDAGIATAENLRWLVAQGYRYLVVSRGGHRQFDPEQSVALGPVVKPSVCKKSSTGTARKSVSTATPRDGSRRKTPSTPASSPASRPDSRNWPTA